jgi:purine-binding chemotaxis protein CheW
MVLGLAVIRGTPVPVVGLASLFATAGQPATRWVLVRTGDKRVALAVDAVLGVAGSTSSRFDTMPPLLRDAAAGMMETIGALDSELLFLLDAAHVLPEEILESLGGLECR